MTREILFRGKRVDNGEWVKGYLICPEFDKSRAYIGYLFPDDDHDLDVAEVASSTVGRFTGLTDRNGVKIFEGDIVRYGQRGAVEYNSGSAQFTLNFANSTYVGFDKIPFCDCEVLGNIYDNPDLLEVNSDE